MAEYQEGKGYKSREQLMSLRDFYYSNAYPDDDGRAAHMASKVYRDLIPFSEYLSNSINNLRKAARVKAECFEVKPRIVLKPLFSLLKLKASDAVVFEKPEGYFYVLDWDDEWGDIDDFDALLKGRNTLCDSSEILDVYNKKLIIGFDQSIDTESYYTLYLRDNDDGIKCRIRELNFADINDYRIASGNAEIVSASEKEGKITCHYNGTLSGKLLLFGKLPCALVERKDLTIQKHAFRMNDISVKEFDANKGIIVAECDDRELQKLYSNGEEIPYSVIGKEEICSILSDESIKFSDGKIEIVDNVFGNAGDKITLHGLKFEINSPMDGVRKTLKDKKTGKYIGTYVELIENEELSNDLYSNVSYFFKETTEYLTDSSTGNNSRRFKIGNKSEKFNQLEICEVVGKNQYVQISDLPSELYVEPNVRQLQMQQNALKMLMDKPCAEHAPLLELMNEKRYSSWSKVPFQSIDIKEWYRLTNLNYEGCDSQREFVSKALATPDFAILEGPPGSGKTTTILEIIAQMIMRGQKVMLAASTNAAIDNILERIEVLPDKVKSRLLAVRIGNESAISDSVKGFTLFDVDADVRDEIIKRANLVCGTTIGILQHPEFQLNNKSQPVIPLYDCLIVDEASKTTFQEFLVPAIYAKKWILSGDLKQLTPYIEQDSIEASLKQIASFDVFHQQAQTILMTLEQSVYKCKDERLKKLRFCICVDEKVIVAVSHLIDDYPYRRIAMIGNIKHAQAVTAREFLSGDMRAVIVYGADIVFVDKHDWAGVEKYIPAGFIALFAGQKSYCDYQNGAFYKNFEANVFNSIIKDFEKFKEQLIKEIKDKSWAGEIAWRLCRVQELFLLSQLDGSSDGQRTRYLKKIEELIPRYARDEISKTISLLKEIALPSIIQLLQQGVDRGIVENKNITALNDGFDDHILRLRHTLVKYQHRMHDDISRFPAKYVYEGQALHNGKTIDRQWNYTEYPKRACWLNISGVADNGRNKNTAEAERIVIEIKKFLSYAKANPKPNGEPWSIACLTYYRAQETELKNRVKKLLSYNRSVSYYKDEKSNVEIMIYTVDKFQGKEADIVFLSMIKSGDAGLGFMDSPNRLNVALTRAKYQIVLVGDKSYFKSNRCRSELLKAVAEEY